MSFTYTIVEIENKKWICPVDEQSGKIYINHKFDSIAFINQFKPGAIFEISEPEHILKNDLKEAKRLLKSAESKLRHPGRYDYLSDEIKEFLKDNNE